MPAGIDYTPWDSNTVEFAAWESLLGCGTAPVRLAGVHAALSQEDDTAEEVFFGYRAVGID